MYLRMSFLGALMAASNVLAVTPLFTAPPELLPDVFPATVGVSMDYAVSVDVLALANASIGVKPDDISVALPGDGVRIFSRVGFGPRRGFVLTAAGVELETGADADDLSFDWYGVADGAEMTLAVERGRVTGSINGALKPRTRSWDFGTFAGTTRLRAVDRSRLPPRLEAEVATDALPELGKIANVNAPATIDLLVVHTDQAVAAAGGLTALNDFVHASLLDLNVALVNSENVRVGVRNVMPQGLESARITYDEQPNVDPTGGDRFRAHRRWLRTQSAATAALRELYDADLVLMLVGDTATTCGIAYAQRPDCAAPESTGCGVGPTYADFAFSVTSAGCTVSEHYLAHEIGHQFGMEHDTISTSTQLKTSFKWSFGYVYSNGSGGGLRTLMPATCLVDCPVQLHFSNPQVNFAAFPGVSTGTTALHLGRYTFNARTAAILAPGMADFRGPKAAESVFGHGFESLPDIVCNPNLYGNCPK